MVFFRKKLQVIYKLIISQIFKLIYGKIILSNENKDHIKIKELEKDDIKYKFVEIENGRIFTDYVEHVAIISKNKIIDHVSYQQVKGELKDPSFNLVIKKGTPKFKKRISGKVFSLVQGASGNNYFHWMFDILPRLIILEKIYHLNEIDYYYCPQLRPWQLSTLSVFKIFEDKIINSNQYRHIHADKVLAVSHPWYQKGYILNEAGNMPKWIIDEISSKFKFYAKKFECKDKFFIDRRESKYNHCQIINDEEIKTYLKSKNFGVYKVGELSFFEQIYLFQNAKMIIGAHGAAFANLIFCKANTRVLDIIPENHPNTVDQTIGRFKDLHFDFIRTKKLPNEKKINGDILLPIDKLKKFL